jgi:holo-[acyl-carrier protein] synthase
MIGIDIVEVERIKNIYQRHGLSFLEKLLDRQEINELPTERSRCFFRKLSCYIAAKEAIYKAYADGDLGWKDIIIRNIAETPIIYIKKYDVTHKIKLAYTIDKEVVISQALMISPDEALVPVSLCHGASTLQPYPGPPLVMSEKIDA